MNTAQPNTPIQKAYLESISSKITLELTAGELNSLINVLMNAKYIESNGLLNLISPIFNKFLQDKVTEVKTETTDEAKPEIIS